MDEILKRDQNFITVLGGVTDDADQDIRMLRVDPISKRLLIKADISSSGVSSINGLTGAITLAAGTNITFDTVGNTITINASGGGSVSFGTEGQIPFMNSTDDDFDYSANIIFDGALKITGTSAQTVLYNSTRHTELFLDTDYKTYFGHGYAGAGGVDSNLQYIFRYFRVGGGAMGYADSGLALVDNGYGHTTVITQTASGSLYWVDSVGSPGSLVIGTIQNPYGGGSIIAFTNLWTIDSNISTNGGAIFNEGGLNVDFRIEGDTDQNLFFVDASTDRIGIGTNTPKGKFDIGGFFTPPAGVPFTTGPVTIISANENGVSGLAMSNVNAGTTADFRFILQDSTGHYIAFSQPGINNSQSTIFGQNRPTADFIFNTGGTTRNLAIGTLAAKDLIFGTNNTERVRILANGNVTITALDTGSTAPTTSGTTKMVITDDNGQLSFADIPIEGLTIGTTTITSGTNFRVLMNNGGVLGEYSTTGTGVVAMNTSPTFITPTLGVATATSINGVVITTGGSSTNYLSEDGTYTTPAGGSSYIPPFIGNTTYAPNAAANTNAANRAWLIVCEVTQPCTITGIRIGVTVSSGNIDVGLYDASFSRLASSGSTACPTANTKATVNFTASAVITPGTYYLALTADNTTVTFTRSGLDTIMGLCFQNTAFPLPTTITPTYTGIGGGDRSFAIVGVVSGGISN